MDDREAEAARRAILSGWITQGPEVEAFEHEFAAAVGSRHACAVSSCTTALHVALLAAGVGPGDEVVTVSHSFIATANAVRYCGAVPVFVDVDPATFNIDPDLIGGAVSDRTRAVLCVHQLGMPCDLARVVAVAHRLGLPVIEDAACAIGSEIRFDGDWQRIGRPHGDIACFSFHPRKVLSTGDGGMLTTGDEALDRQFRRLRQHGMTISDTARHAASTVLFEEYPVIGFNYRMTDIQAAIGREQLKRLDEVIAVRRARAARYRAAFAGAADIAAPPEPEWARSNWQSYAVTLGPAVRQRDVMQALLNAGIATRRPAMNAHREAAYASGWTLGCASLAHSEAIQDTAIVLPLYHAMTDADQDRVIDELRRCSR
jgi:dTDP-4-amino-4,6-dideoxygalactose transaminase